MLLEYNTLIMEKSIMRCCFALFLILVVSCKNNKDPVQMEVFETDFIGKSELTLEGTDTGLEIMGVKDICVCDSLLIAFTKNPESQIQVYRMSDMHLVAKLCPRGRAGNEMTDPNGLSGQFYYRKGNLILPVIDNYQLLKEINITKSISNMNTVVETKTDCMPLMQGNFVLIDDDIDNRFEFHSDQIDEIYADQISYPMFIIRKKNKEQKINLYNKLMDSPSLHYSAGFYYGTVYKSPVRNMIIQPLQYMDYIMFFDLDNDKRFAIHQKGTMCIGDKAPDEARIHLLNYLAISNKYFIVNHKFHDAESMPKDKSPYELLIFDWDGNFINSARLDHKVSRIAFDEKSNILYGIGLSEEKMYKYDMSKLLPATSVK